MKAKSRANDFLAKSRYNVAAQLLDDFETAVLGICQLGVGFSMMPYEEGVGRMTAWFREEMTRENHRTDRVLAELGARGRARRAAA